ncbi:hypothetical protein SAMN04487934_10437 [Eubacterium ruminantium]|nr:hypothetical protein SAMN04487934_10437 [Eubacterium ruminantium]
MKYFTKEIPDEKYLVKTAGVKARDDVETILEGAGYQELRIPAIMEDRRSLGKVKKFQAHFQIRKVWSKVTRDIGAGDTILIQYPTIEHSIFLSSVFRDIRKRGGRIIFLIHDLDYLRMAVAGYENMTRMKKKRLEIEQKALHFGNRIIVHNQDMLEKMVELGLDRRKLVSLEIFDYIIPELTEDMVVPSEPKDDSLDAPVIIAGNLSRTKAGYVYNLPDTVKFNLYGVNYEDEEKSNIFYKGSFMPDELPYNLSGSFGLVWDGESAEECEGAFGKYLKINNPHKTSLYLASGIPVIIWKEAALAKFVQENEAGIVVDSLYEIPDKLKSLSNEDYERLKNGARSVSEKLKKGYFTLAAVKKCKG